MLNRSHKQLSIREKIVRSIAILAVAIVVFCFYFHNSIDAFSLGCRTLPSSQLLNDQASKDSSSYEILRARTPFLSLHAKGVNDDDDDDLVSQINTNENTEFGAKNGNNGYDSSSPFFATRDDHNQISDGKMNDSSLPFFAEKEDRIQFTELDAGSNDSDSSLPFFAMKEIQVEKTGRASTISIQQSRQQRLGVSAGDSMFPFFPKKVDPTQMIVRLQVDEIKFSTVKSIDMSPDDPSSVTPMKVPYAFTPKDGSWDSYLERPTSLLKRASNEEFKELVSSPQTLSDESSEVFDKTVKTALGTIALLKIIPPKVDEGIEMTEKIVKDVQEVSTQVTNIARETTQTVGDTILKAQEIVNEVEEVARETTQTVEGTVLKARKIGKATIAAATFVLRIGKGAGSLAWNGSKSIYNVITQANEEISDEEPMEAGKPTEQKVEVVENNLSVKEALKASNVEPKKQKVTLEQDSPAIQSAKVQPVITQPSSTPKVDPSMSAWEQMEAREAKEKARQKTATNTQQKTASGLNTNNVSSESRPSRTKRNRIPVFGGTNAGNQPAVVNGVAMEVGHKSTKEEHVDKSKIGSVTTARKSAVKVAYTSLEELNNELEVSRKLVKELSDRMDSAERAMKMKPDIGFNLQLTKPAVKAGAKSLEELSEDIEAAQILAKELSDVMDLAELAMNMKQEIRLVKPINEIEEQTLNETVESNVPSPLSLNPTAKEKTDLVKDEDKQKNVVSAIFARLKAAKTEDDLDAEFAEIESLTNEVANALEVAEKSLVLASTNTDSADDDSSRSNKTP